MTGYFGELNTIIHYEGDRYSKYRDNHGFELGNISNKQLSNYLIRPVSYDIKNYGNLVSRVLSYSSPGAREGETTQRHPCNKCYISVQCVYI